MMQQPTLVVLRGDTICRKVLRVLGKEAVLSAFYENVVQKEIKGIPSVILFLALVCLFVVNGRSRGKSLISLFHPMPFDRRDSLAKFCL